MLTEGKKRFVKILGGALALVILGAVAFGAVDVVSASKVTAADLETMTRASAQPGLLEDGYLSHGRGFGFGGGDINYSELLAAELGISVEELENAYEEAREAAIEQAVEEGLITQEQADQMLVWGDRRGFGFKGFGRAPKGVGAGAIDENALLADALGVSVETLQAAREAANEAALAQAVEEGLITQEQADEMLSRKALMDYLNRDSLLAAALGMTVEELQAAYEEGKTLSTLLEDRGLDAVTVRDRLMTAYEEALAQAVADGVITQEQADEMASRGTWGFGRGCRLGFSGREGFEMPRDFDGPMMRRGRGGFGDFGNRYSAPESDNDVSGPGLRHPGQGVIRGDSDL
ncbi:MAG: hypothetical protein ACP5JG_09830 [Anaerolineae bacterium]